MPAGEPAMPRGLTTAQRRIWKETVAILSTVPGLLTTAEADALANYCRAEAAIEQLHAAMQAAVKRRIAASAAEIDAGNITSAEIESAVLADYERRLQAHTRQSIHLSDRLGLNAAARSRMHVDAPVAPPARDPLKSALFGGGPQLVKAQ